MAAVQYHEGRFPPEQRLDWPKLIPLIGPAAAAVARYDGMLGATPNPDVLLAPLTTQEAVLSSRIEGTQATMGEVLEFEAGGEPESPARREDIHEVLNYRSAMRHAEEMMQELPLCMRVIRDAHRILLAGVRGEGKSPGEYRRVPNWIGPAGCTIDGATFVPVAAGKLPEAMGAWESYIHREAPDRLVQLAILHAEFEALHPFLDGNGRLGRMLVPLFLWRSGLIRTPRFYVSAYLEARRDAYYDGLLAVSRDDDWTGWCRFFLEAVRIQAEDNLAKAQGIIDLYDRMKRRVADLTHSQHAIRALDWIFQYPILVTTHFVSRAGIPQATARRILRVLRDGEILKALRAGRGRRASTLMFPDLLNIAEGRDVF
ncbi:MAG: Fic family protein [Spirochaetaceae bacterium]|nr:Fic family protein [Spirochaetaceae bacterium]